jgi:hypothetical protein
MPMGPARRCHSAQTGSGVQRYRVAGGRTLRMVN